jgi:hypothetical protein
VSCQEFLDRRDGKCLGAGPIHYAAAELVETLARETETVITSR